MIKTAEQSVHLNGFEEDLSRIPDLVITEIVVNSKNRKGKDAFEFIEVYNTTHEPISLKHYQLRYRNPAQGTEMDDVYSFHTKPVTLSPGKPYVFWLRKKGQEHLTVADFNAMYKSQLKEGEHVSVIESKGLSNSKSRLVSITTNIGEEISSAAFRLKPSWFSEHKSLLFKYPMDGTRICPFPNVWILTCAVWTVCFVFLISSHSLEGIASICVIKSCNPAIPNSTS
nr:lamin tail domain-containing protein [Bacillus subtilis]